MIDFGNIVRAHLDHDAKYLLSLSAKSDRTGAPVFGGIPYGEKLRRRAAGKVAKASRKANR